MVSKESPTGPLYRPQVGELVEDGTTGRDVVYMGVPAEPRGRTA